MPASLDIAVFYSVLYSATSDTSLFWCSSQGAFPDFLSLVLVILFPLYFELSAISACTVFFLFALSAASLSFVKSLCK